jgi:cytochrome bd-type quinol oxidase subunit 1
VDALFLSRIQFAVTTMFHILFPALTIGLSVYLVVLEFLWLRNRDEIYYRMYRFWSKIFWSLSSAPIFPVSLKRSAMSFRLFWLLR